MVEKDTFSKGKFFPQEVVNKALRETDQFLFPMRKIQKYPGLEEAVRKSEEFDRKSDRVIASSLRVIAKLFSELTVKEMDILRYIGSGYSIEKAVHSDPTASVVRWSVAAGVLMSPNIIYLASKIKPVARVGRALRESVINKIDPANKIIRR